MGVSECQCWILAVQWLRRLVSTVGGAGSIPGQGTKIPLAMWHSKKKNKKRMSMS